MDSLIETFHIDIKLLLAQALNFAVAFSVLYFFALKPLVKVMSERTKKIEKSLKDSEEIEKKLIETEEDYKNEIGRAKKEANELIEKARLVADVKNKELLEHAKEHILQLARQEKAKIETDKARTVKEIKDEIAGLVTASVLKILEGKLDPERDRGLINRILEEAGK